MQVVLVPKRQRLVVVGRPCEACLRARRPTPHHMYVMRAKKSLLRNPHSHSGSRVRRTCAASKRSRSNEVLQGEARNRYKNASPAYVLDFAM